MYKITIALLFYLNILFIFSVGALYGGLAAIQTVFTYFGAMVFNAIYKNTVQTNKRLYLIVIIALLIVALILSM